ncbi:hypothetical protein QMZ92_23865 [Streptomyces sp. HNM0645]|nr:hypothetical protein [Streptomyces sp. HNM0645]MDI9887323.1 hypothetical protein [Streptomyces sp. HNM0645]
MIPVDLDPIVAGIGLLILAAMALLIALNPRQQRVQPARVNPPKEQQ